MMVWCALTSGLLLSPRAPPLAPSARRAARSSCVIAYTPPKIEDLSVGQVIPCKVAEVLSDGSYKVDIGSTTLATIPAGEVFLDANASAYANPNASLAVEEDVALPVGGVFEGQVMEMDGEQTKISLAAVSRNLAWKRVVQIQTCDATYLATVLRMGKAGALVNVENLAAFLPWSHWHLSEGSRSEELVGKELAVKILEVDRQRSRLVVSHRRVQLAARLEQLRPGQLINGKISSLRPYGAVVTIADGLDGLLHISQVSNVFVRDISTVFSPGDEIRCVVIKVDPTDGSVNLSTKMLEEQGGDMITDSKSVFERASILEAVALESKDD